MAIYKWSFLCVTYLFFLFWFLYLNPVISLEVLYRTIFQGGWCIVYGWVNMTRFVYLASYILSSSIHVGAHFYLSDMVRYEWAPIWIRIVIMTCMDMYLNMLFWSWLFVFYFLWIILNQCLENVLPWFLSFNGTLIGNKSLSLSL